MRAPAAACLSDCGDDAVTQPAASTAARIEALLMASPWSSADAALLIQVKQGPKPGSIALDQKRAAGRTYTWPEMTAQSSQASANEIVARQDFSEATYLLEVRHPLMAKAA